VRAGDERRRSGAMSRGWPSGLIGLLWLLWALYWVIAACGVKPVRQREPMASRLAFVVPSLLGALLLIIGHRLTGSLGARLIGGGWMRYGIALGLVVIGITFGIWARRTLGGNWSGTVTLKVDHELVQSGPYRWIRHPIYTGLLLAVLGTGLAAGRLYGVVAFVLILLALLWKLRVEERWMRAEFGERYEQYRRSSWALIPFVF
jgi:protein-S-isoprenylcysteine O-methyltransferase Ste14